MNIPNRGQSIITFASTLAAALSEDEAGFLIDLEQVLLTVDVNLGLASDLGLSSSSGDSKTLSKEQEEVSSS